MTPVRSRLGMAAVVAAVAFAMPAIARDTPLLAPDDHATYRAAFKAADRGDWTRAHRLARAPKERLPAKILDWMDMSRAGSGRSFEEIARFIRDNPDWPAQRTLQRRAEEAMLESEAPDDVLRWFAKRTPQTTDGSVRLIAAFLAKGERERAVRLIRETWTDASFGSKQERLFRRRYGKHLTADDHAARLDRMLWRGNVLQARRTLRYVSKPLQQLAQARIALRAFRGGVDWHIRQVPSAHQNDFGLIYERIRWRRRKDRDADAYELLRKVPATAPYAEQWWNERAILARRLLAKGHVSEAYRLAKANGLSEGVSFVEAEWLAGWIALRFLREYGDARAHFERIHAYVNYPISKARAAYWIGRAAEGAGDSKAAARYFAEASRYDTTWYGQLSAARTKGHVRVGGTPVRPREKDRLAFDRDERVRAVRVLAQIRADDWVGIFVDKLGHPSRGPAMQYLAARLALDVGRQDLAVRVARKAAQHGVEMPQIAYPVIAMPNGRPEQALLLALARQESNFDTRAISRSGARGLMQLMPGTAREVAKSLRLRYSRGKLTQDPEYNIRLGRAYLARMINRFDGSYILAIAAYNAGPSAVSRWLRTNGDPRHSDVDPIDWIEMIPYRETRNYVQRVMENLQIYRARLDGPLLAEAVFKDLER